MIDFPKYRRHGAYHWRLFEEDEVYQDLVRFICSLPNSKCRILDLGCGDGVYVGQLALLGHDIIGIDGDSDAVALARDQLAKRSLTNAEVIHASLGQFANSSPRAQSFDLVYSMDVIEHLPDPLELIRVATQFCKRDGVICIGTPIFRSEATVSPYHVKEYTKEEFGQLLEPFMDSLQIHCLRARREHGIVIEQGYMCGIGKPC
ncbi:class I SAM-dependent methyltransferase [Neorhodopirellula pilleata]|uniref:class I SAM-dependent methyltransferase n=1 Tax=Neorhodopirellula pilleata TaxID=2714738 RepID=UPI001E456E93|nr:methyltransferase domain-containing protein [Neorhodopirellula pilleata]